MARLASISEQLMSELRYQTVDMRPNYDATRDEPIVLPARYPNLLVNVTNDAWFVGTAAPRLHVRLSAMRAIELRRDLVRSVNLGVAAWIDASGTVRAENDSPKPGVLMAEPSLRSGETIYSRFGDWPMALLMLCATAGSVWRRRQSTVSGAPP